MQIIMIIIGIVLATAAIIIAFEVPGANENYQSIGYVGCLFLLISGGAIGNINLELLFKEGIYNGPIFAFFILLISILTLVYWNKKK